MNSPSTGIGDEVSRSGVPSAIGMTIVALGIGFAVDVQLGLYDPGALFLLTIALVMCAASIGISKFDFLISPRFNSPLMLNAVLAGGVFAQAVVMLREMKVPPGSGPESYVAVKVIGICVGIMTLAWFLQVFAARRFQSPILIFALALFCAAGIKAFTVMGKDLRVDVWLFQQQGSEALLHLRNPYTLRIPNLYGPDTAYYGPEIMNKSNNTLTVGYCYFPLSLLMVLPGYLLGGDVRYALVVAAAISSALLAKVGKSKTSMLAGGLFILTPCAFLVLDMSWTDTLLVLNFSILMWCACRWRKMLPYALGIFLATKQYSVLSIPAVWLLAEGPNPGRQMISMLAKAFALAAMITLPFFLWGPWDFWHSVVLMQIRQPFRADALSYLVWYSRLVGHVPADWMNWLVPLLVLIAVTIFAVYRSPHTPAGFAASAALINLAFFAFSKQAFCNYYFFVFAAACWAVAATRTSTNNIPQQASSDDMDSGKLA